MLLKGGFYELFWTIYFLIGGLFFCHLGGNKEIFFELLFLTLSPLIQFFVILISVDFG